MRVVMSGADELLGHQSNGHGNVDVASNSLLPVDELLSIDEALGLLDPLALDELQFLADSPVFADSAAEDSLRCE